ncbi:MAG TPA: hypothetical protein VLE25_14655 [Nitrospira sp.]|jgi:hypothetical protein|nr:hypothetical protein [Nitrospira sp.]
MYILYAAVTIVLLFSGCGSTPPETKSDNPTARRLLGKTRAELLQCAGTPLREVPYGPGVILRYYKEAPMLEESRSFLKGSTPGEHHGCWASLLIENEEVTGVEFRTVPQGAGNEDDDCEVIFTGCLQ